MPAVRPATIFKGHTLTDLRLTRAPADTPRGRLHQAAMAGARAARRASSSTSATASIARSRPWHRSPRSTCRRSARS